MDIIRDPSNPIESFRYPNLHIVDNAGIFSTLLGGLLTYPIDGIEYNVLSNNIKLIIYTSISERSNWKVTNLSTNEIAVFIFKYANKLKFRIKLADNLFILSRFHSYKQMFEFEKELRIQDFIGQKLSIEFILRYFDTLNEPLFNIITNAQSKTVVKTIKITKTGDMKPIKLDPKEDKLNITFGLFFDGTGNNRYNTERVHDVFSRLAETQSKLFSEVIDEYRLGKISFLREKSIGFDEFMFMPKSSYLNNYSNISILYDLYSETKVGEETKENEIIKKIYVEGIGTKREEKDSLLGSGFGRGEYGIESRCKELIFLIDKEISHLQFKFKNVDIAEVVFDIFGFSRGAAAARLFHRMVFIDSNLSTSNFIHLVKLGVCKIRFYGLFDTVLSTFNADVLYPTEKDISLIECKKIPCYHITAQNEIRQNFPLSKVDSENCVHLELFGCHSDIGGSYTRDKFASAFAFKESEKDKPTYDFKKLYDRYKLLYAVDTSKKYLRYFVNQLSVNYEQIRIVTENVPENERYKGLDSNYASTIKFGYVAQENRVIESDISMVALNAMLSFALQHNLPFNARKKEVNPKLSPKDKLTLENYDNKVQKLIGKIINSNNVSESLEDNDFFDLYNRFIHISESYGYQIWSDKFKSKIHELNELYSDRPAEKGERVVY
ncbi:DUF2235 domain-containing protein [Flavobacterium johnsoniae]|uniref:hypothetical protein n=1 Tax=Flavobacterium johnsoniae TaxID=986 RepID=UPI0025AF7CD5|nr:hypothetical protein [Flavobacterium johnsoniae]WJS96805.1 DUF2235 domain-containing protein [Flavobacterium johnsoniae]